MRTLVWAAVFDRRFRALTSDAAADVDGDPILSLTLLLLLLVVFVVVPLPPVPLIVAVVATVAPLILLLP